MMQEELATPWESSQSQAGLLDQFDGDSVLHPGEQQPMMPQVGIVALVPDQWKREWQPRHQIMSRLARHFNVVWVNPAPHWREIARARQASPSPAPGMQIYDPDLWLPRVHKPTALREMLLRARVMRARRLLKARGVTRFVLYVWRPEFAAAVGAGGFDLTCYHIDDEYTFSSADRPIRSRERRLLEDVDQVFIHSRTLMMKKGHVNPHTLRVPNGVDLRAFSGPGPLPSDLAAVPGPRIGYAGYLKDQLDWRLLTDIAEARPDWSLVLVGVDKVRSPENRQLLDALLARNNVYALGEKTTNQLALYPRHFDVCVMPYVRDGYTRYIYPLKLHEYLATGRPVVGTPIDTLLEYGDVVTLARSSGEWVSSIANALAGDQPARASARIAVAARHDWEILTRRIADTIASRLEIGGRLASAQPVEQSPSETAA